jgi:hypothetical protein
MAKAEAVMTIYRGYRESQVGHQLVTKDNDLLMPGPSQKVWNHSPGGFNWGYGGSGPAQLALAILLDVTGDEKLAVEHHQAFKWAFVSGWGDRWEISSEQILEWLKTREIAVNA